MQFKIRTVYRLDKSYFKKQSLKEADNNRKYCLSKTPMERLNAAWYLTCHAYGIDPSKEHKLDKTIFSKRKHKP